VRACFAGGALLASACGYAKLPCAVSGREFMLIYTRTNLCAAAAIGSALLGCEVCVLADCLLGCPVSGVLQLWCSTNAPQLLPVEYDR
jgi:hypothetical protein